MIEVQLHPVMSVSISPAENGFGDAIMRTLAYADVFDYALSLEQIWRYLIGVHADYRSLEIEVETALLPAGRIGRNGGLFFLPGREALASLRRERSVRETRLWPRARRYGSWLAHLPFVRMAAVTGALAMDNEPGRDLDFLVVTAPDRLWVCRGLVMLLVRLARIYGDELCPNYFISTRSLRFLSNNLYTAHELAQMVPLYGKEVFEVILLENSWAVSYLPNAFGLLQLGDENTPIEVGRMGKRLRILIESGLTSRTGEKLEVWERRRKIAMLQEKGGAGSETDFDPDQCKGHFGSYGSKTLTAYLERLESLGLAYG